MSNRIIRSIPIITFHKVDPAFEWGVTRVTPHQFNTVIRFLAEQGYRTVSLDSVYNNSSLPGKPIVLTFDDGYESVYTNAAPILKKYGFTATVFLISAYIGRTNHWDVNLGGRTFPHLKRSQIRNLLQDGFEIGSHTVHHPDLTRMPVSTIREELSVSKKSLEELTGQEVKSISFPFGRYNKMIIEECQSAGYSYCCGFWRKSWVNDSKEPFVFERKAYYLFDTLINLQAKCGHGLLAELEKLKLRLINLFSHGTALVKPHRF